MTGAEDGLGEHDARPLTRRETWGAGIACMIALAVGILGGEHLIFIPGL